MVLPVTTAFGLLCAFPARAYALDDARQVAIVIVSDWNSVDGLLQRFQRHGTRDAWMAVGKSIPIVVGKNGLAWGKGLINAQRLGADPNDPVKREGDGKAPAGVFSLDASFGYASRRPAGSRMPYLRLTSSMECVDDMKSSYYNRIVDRWQIQSPDWSSSERMLRHDGIYRWGVYVEHNARPVKPGAGSCIFLHVWRAAGQGTAGCTAMPKGDVELLLTWLDPAKSPRLVQLPRPLYERVRKRLALPSIPASHL